jgi:hypothetical protein
VRQTLELNRLCAKPLQRSKRSQQSEFTIATQRTALQRTVATRNLPSASAIWTADAQPAFVKQI